MRGGSGLNNFYAKCAHNNVKVNMFGPIICYHNLCTCNHEKKLTFHNDDKIICVDIKKYANKLIKIIKITEISARIVLLLMAFENYAIKDALIHMSIVMYHII